MRPQRGNVGKFNILFIYDTANFEGGVSLTFRIECESVS